MIESMKLSSPEGEEKESVKSKSEGFFDSDYANVTTHPPSHN